MGGWAGCARRWAGCAEVVGGNAKVVWEGRAVWEAGWG